MQPPESQDYPQRKAEDYRHRHQKFARDVSQIECGLALSVLLLCSWCCELTRHIQFVFYHYINIKEFFCFRGGTKRKKEQAFSITLSQLVCCIPKISVSDWLLQQEAATFRIEQNGRKVKHFSSVWKTQDPRPGKLRPGKWKPGTLRKLRPGKLIIIICNRSYNDCLRRLYFRHLGGCIFSSLCQVLLLMFLCFIFLSWHL